jgi:hypothetical protein
MSTTDLGSLPFPETACIERTCGSYRSLTLEIDRRRPHYSPAKWRSCTLKRWELFEENASLKKGLEFLLGRHFRLLIATLPQPAP